MKDIVIIDKHNGVKYTPFSFAFAAAKKENSSIHYEDIDCVAKAIDDDQYYIIDNEGNSLWIDSKKYSVERRNS